jgi:hypothetical protein
MLTCQETGTEGLVCPQLQTREFIKGISSWCPSSLLRVLSVFVPQKTDFLVLLSSTTILELTCCVILLNLLCGSHLQAGARYPAVFTLLTCSLSLHYRRTVQDSHCGFIYPRGVQPHMVIILPLLTSFLHLLGRE